MSDATTLGTVLPPQATVLDTTDALLDQIAELAPEGKQPPPAPEPEPEQDEKALNTLLRKAESAFTRGNKGLLLSRVECGKWCHAIYVLRQEQGHKDRGFTSQLIFNRLAVHADSKRECDATELAKLYKAVELLAEGDNWKTLSLGKLLDLCVLVSRADGTELYDVFSKDKVTEAKALFAWACGDGMKRPSREDIQGRVLELVNPEKYAEKQAAKQAAKVDEQAAEEEPEPEEPEAPENLIPTETRTTPPDWKDVPDGMAALFQEGCKQQPGHSGDMMRDFARQFVWTTAMVKGLIAGMAESKDAEQAERAMQALVDAIADEYAIFPAAELQDAA
jgi:hypothetical protein